MSDAIINHLAHFELAFTGFKYSCFCLFTSWKLLNSHPLAALIILTQPHHSASSFSQQLDLFISSWKSISVELFFLFVERDGWRSPWPFRDWLGQIQWVRPHELIAFYSPRSVRCGENFISFEIS